MSPKHDPKTRPSEVSVDEFIAAVPDERKRSDASRLRDMMEEISGEPAVMWGPSIIGFGHYHYRYESGHEGDAPSVGFSPRTANLVLYILGGFTGQEDILARLGKHKTGKACLYINRLSDIDESILREMIERSFAHAARINVES